MQRNATRGGDKKAKAEYDILAKIKNLVVAEKKDVRFGDWHSNDVSMKPDSEMLSDCKKLIYFVVCCYSVCL